MPRRSGARRAPVSAATRRQVRAAGGDLATAATQRIEDRYAWYADLSAKQRSWVAQVAQAGITGFINKMFSLVKTKSAGTPSL